MIVTLEELCERLIKEKENIISHAMEIDEEFYKNHENDDEFYRDLEYKNLELEYKKNHNSYNERDNYKHVTVEIRVMDNYTKAYLDVYVDKNWSDKKIENYVKRNLCIEIKERF